MKTAASKIKTLGMSLLIFAFTLAAMPSALADPPPWAPAHGYRAKKAKMYKYYYYPAQQVYYRPNYGYYYMDNNNWRYAPRLPTTINLGNRVSIDLGTPLPYTQHPVVLQQYPLVVVP